MRGTVLKIAFLICTAFTVHAQDVNVTAAFDSSSVFIGDQVWFTVKVDKPAASLVSVQQLADTLTGGLMIISGPSGDTSFLKTGRSIITHRYLVTAFDSGTYTVKPLYASTFSQGREMRFFSDYTKLLVKRVSITPPDTAQKYFDIIRPYRAPLRARDIIPWALAACLLAVSVWYAVLLIKRFKGRKSENEAPEVEEPAHIVALRSLNELAGENLWQKGQLKEYYSRLSEIIRIYISSRYGVDAPELTSSETLFELRKAGYRDEKGTGILKQILSSSDLVKFAKYLPDASENDKIMQESVLFVEQTAPDTAEVKTATDENAKEGKR